MRACGEKGKFVTKLLENQVTYTFWHLKQEVKFHIFIKQRKNNLQQSFYIPNQYFEKKLPDILIYNYSHWWNTTENVIEFRPIKYTQ